MTVVKLNNFNADYIMHNQSIFKMGAENPQLKMTGMTNLSLLPIPVKLYTHFLIKVNSF